MTSIAFHFGVLDKVGYTCRLLRKAVNSGARIEVVADAPTLGRLSTQLWALSPTDFVPHCTALEVGVLQELSPVLLAPAPASPPERRQVLVNLGNGVPQGYEDFERLIEVVSGEDEDRALARARWKHYTIAGYSIARHDVGLKGSNP